MSQEVWEKLPRIDLKTPASFKGKELFTFYERQQTVCVRHSNGYKKPTIRRIKIIRFFTVESPKYRTDYLEAFCYLRKESRVFKATDLTILSASECPEVSEDMSTESCSTVDVSTTQNLGSIKKHVGGPTKVAREVSCEIIDVDLISDDGRLIPSVQAICSKCGHVTESFGADLPSIKRCLAEMRDECPRGQQNFYVQN